jgi:TrmH family RNA methyltransferase
MKSWKDNVTFVLVGPREPGNIGASARALKNMGFKHLALVGAPALTDETKWFAHNSLDVLESASVHHRLEDVLHDKTIVAGTTRRKGKRRGVIYPVDQGARKLLALASDNKVAILFGREDRGLFNKEVEECGFLMSVPVSSDHPSLNLAQAVLLVAYELSRAEYRDSESKSQPDIKPIRLVPHEELTALTVKISETLRMLEYIPRGDRDLEKKIMLNLKHFIGRAGLTEWELGMFHGIIAQLTRKLNSSNQYDVKKE